ncbi:MAG: helix-turn-helix domain-containing protein [Desulfobacteraceae bacterium]|nr:MAG: helix-turn-helix domain-containing protein [Desulfobacteraceae bacterium]
MKFTIHEVAQCLNLPEITIERWIRQGRIPIQKSSNGYILNEAALEKWAALYKLPFSMPRKVKIRHKEERMESLLTAMKRGGVLHDLKGDDVETVLKSAVENMPVLSNNSREEIYRHLLEREHLTSTGIGKGVAIPHPHDPLSDTLESSVISTCFLENPIDFGAVDDKPVFVMFILLSQSIKIHLHLLSRLSFCVRDNAFVEFLKTSPDSAMFFSKIADFEKRLDRADIY